MTSGTFPRQRKFPASLFKGIHRPLRRVLFRALGIGTDFSVDRQERQSQAGSALGMGSCLAAWEHVCP